MVSRGAIALAVMLSVSGCAQRGARGAPKAWPAADWIVDGRTGERVLFAQMIDELATADVVFVGEDHHNPHHHEAQRRIIEALSARKPDLAIGMEMLQTDAQPIADRWVAGELDLDGFIAATNWERTWGFPIALYRPILELAQTKRTPIIALNAPDRMVKRLREAGIEGLTAEERTALPEMDLKNDAHRDWVREAMGAHHAMKADRFERAYSIQVLWDESMAESVVRAKRPMVVIAGTGHLIRRMGIPARVERREKSLKTRVVLALPVLANTPKEIRASVKAHDADWLWITPDEEHP